MAWQREDRILMRNQTSCELEAGEAIEKFNKNKEIEKEANPLQLLPQTILQMLDTAIIVTDASGEILFLNALAEKITGWSFHDTKYFPLSYIFKIVGKVTLSNLDIPIEKNPCKGQNPYFLDDVFLIRPDNSSISIQYSLSSVYDGNQIVGTALVFRDISALYRPNHQQPHQINHDPLTGLVNRSSFESYLKQALHDSRNLAQTHILCHLDLDRFKIINEVCGHLAGDEYLRKFSTVLQQRIRRTDILARLGGDEFGLILQHCNLDQALNVVQDLYKEVRQFRFSWQSHTFSFTFSTGITLLQSDSQSISNVLIEADSACTVAKAKGRDRVQVYQADDQDVTAQRGDTQGLLLVMKALEEDQFLLYCQPIVPVSDVDDSTDQRCYEILIRLQDGQGQIIPPKDFLPAAERYGLMHLVDRWVIHNLFKILASRYAKAEESAYEPTCKSYRNHCYSINLSGSSFNDDQFLEFVQEQFFLHLVPPESICFEITETVAISNLNKAAKFIAQLRAIGCRFALDDFGSGMSSFGYLRNLPVDYIKIDGNFVKEITTNVISYEIVKAINSIGHVMNIQTTAEFVEDEEILAMLKAIGVDYAQGYGIAKPFPLRLLIS
ncbi:EAL domain-containing protein [Stenomitos frigidus]|uniref:Histidine kinase n=1 Tax=Stenomitos frigidus ULC18 TaxID=2107698 RepID=A0A2T1DVD8_9CYAN|nr:EAL domain-containing protein [Stenomitos frigidus]PSB24450.1 histidine kinase [Stenomitos frigidus ULC18]